MYDREGKPIGMRDWGRLLGDREYRVVAKDTVGAYEVSTVWLGVDHGFSGGPPVIFETMVFGAGHPGDLDCWRYCTEAEAQRGHAEVVLLLRATVETEPPRPPLRMPRQQGREEP